MWTVTQDVLLFAVFVASLVGSARLAKGEEENVLLHQLVSKAMHDYRNVVQESGDMRWMRTQADLLGVANSACVVMYTTEIALQLHHSAKATVLIVWIARGMAAGGQEAGEQATTTDIEYCVAEQFRTCLRRITSLTKARNALAQLR